MTMTDLIIVAVIITIVFVAVGAINSVKDID